MLLRKISDNIQQNRLLRDDKPVIAAVSGGADSVALLVALHKLGYECIVAHCNYHLRGEESNRDMRAVQALCSRLGVDLYVRDFDVEQRRRATGESVEMACRELRYQWFADLLDRRRAQAIAVAHHQEDNVETFFLNLMRGSSIGGLTGMRWRNGYVVRPMLDATRAEIESFLQKEEVDFVNDSTNASNIYSRNRLRNVILPMIEEQFPGATEGILSSIRLLKENRAVYDEAIAEKDEKYHIGNQIDLASLVRDEQNAATVLFEMLRQWGFNATHVRNIIDSAKKSGISFTSGNTTLELDRGRLIITAHNGLSADDAETQVFLTRDILAPVHVLVSEHPITDFKPERDAAVAYFDAEILAGNPRFTLRHWRRGDRMKPFGMEGDKLVSDIFADAKFSAKEKREAWLLTRDEEIIWVMGVRASSVFSVIPETRRYLRLSLAT